MSKGRLPQTPVQQGKKSFKKVIIDHVEGLHEEVVSIKREMNEEIEKRFNEKNDDLIHQVQSALDGATAIRTILKRKGKITQEEYNEEKAEMRKK